MPDSVEAPAPVSTVTRRAPATTAPAASTSTPPPFHIRRGGISGCRGKMRWERLRACAGAHDVGWLRCRSSRFDNDDRGLVPALAAIGIGEQEQLRGARAPWLGGLGERVWRGHQGRGGGDDSRSGVLCAPLHVWTSSIRRVDRNSFWHHHGNGGGTCHRPREQRGRDGRDQPDRTGRCPLWCCAGD